MDSSSTKDMDSLVISGGTLAAVKCVVKDQQYHRLQDDELFRTSYLADFSFLCPRNGIFDPTISDHAKSRFRTRFLIRKPSLNI